MWFKKNGAGVLLGIAVTVFGASASANSLVDKSFDPGSGANGLVETVIAQPDGKILISGNFTQFNGVSKGYIARLNSDGSIDQSFNAQPSYWVRTMALQSDGKIVIGGFFNGVQGQNYTLIARLNSDGSLDTSFNPHGGGASGTLGIGIDGKSDPFIFATAVEPDGKILITGNFTNYNGTQINGIARLNSDGSLDTSFDVGDGLNLNSWGRSLTLLNNDRFMVTGWFNHYNHADHSRMALVNADGSADSTFAPNFGDQTAVYSAVPLPNGQYIVSGHSENVHQIFQQDIARLNADGSFDTSFVGSANDKTEMVRLQSDGKILLCGYFTSVDGQTRTSVARMNSDGTLDTSFNVNVDNYAWSMFIQPDGRILVSGGFHTVDGFSRNGIVRLFPTEQPEDSIPPTLDVKNPGPNNNTIASESLTMAGTAEDTNGVKDVSVSVNGQSVPVTGTSNWTATASFVPGTNVVVFSATDIYGNTASQTRYLFHPARVQLTITTDGNGTVTPNLNGMAEVGHTYTVTAVPKRGFVFNTWSGSATSSNATLTFMMQPGFTLQASFVPNPFTNSAGTYHGLAFNQSAPDSSTAGSVSLTETSNGNFTGHMVFGGVPYAFTGRFTSDLNGSATIRRGRSKPALQIQLQIVDAQTIQGTISDGSFTSSLTAYKTVFGARNTAAAFKGSYTVLLPGNANAGAPAGYSYLNISAGAGGTALVSGALADSTILATVTSLGPNGQIAIYYPFPRGAVFGWLTLTPNDSSDTDVQGTLHWQKNSRTNTVFSIDMSAIGSIYHAPHAGASMLTLNNPTLQVDGGSLANPLSDTFTLNHNHVTFTQPNTNRFSLALVPANGRFIGTFVDPATKRPGVFQGVVLQKQNMAGGFDSSSRQFGRVFFAETGTTPP